MEYAIVLRPLTLILIYVLIAQSPTALSALIIFAKYAGME